MAAVLNINGRTKRKSRSCTKTIFNDRWNMIMKWHIRLKQNTENFRWVTWKDDVRVKININYLRVDISEIKKNIIYSVLLGLADNLLATNQEKNIFNAKLNNRYGEWCICSGENKICVWVSSA